MKKATLFVVAAILVLVFVAATSATAAEADEGWQWSISPYMWASDISEDLIIDGSVVGGDDTEFNDLVDLIDTSLQLHFEGMREHWGLFADLTYIELSDSSTGDSGFLTVDAEIEEILFEAGAIYKPGGRDGNLELLAGARMLSVDEQYEFRLGEQDPRFVRNDEDYLDLLLGARYTVPLAERWALSFKGDVSFGDSDYMWTAQALVGWLFGRDRQHAVFFGYRYRDMKYEKADVIDVEKTLSGIGLGVKIGF